MVIFTFLLECLCVCVRVQVSPWCFSTVLQSGCFCVFLFLPGQAFKLDLLQLLSTRGFGLQFLLGFQSMSAEMGFEAGIGVVQALFRLGVGWVYARCVVSLVCEDLVLGWWVELGSVKASRRHRGVLGKFLV